ncbi:hypothetical protein [Bifidobacterium simiarum]|uniref:hypothetical protein n=1 Tax=Bifidobacterium simiarum TaxID=2045441 RepID=UPI001BDCF034|nr:hypothetical protein [Bifidobacterium simiarum]MBT1166730.1 hypothetical protein [Bifidobacterium simiarum]
MPCGGRKPPPDELKGRFDALGVAIRAGVEPEDAAERLGLTGIRFTGMVPVNLKEADDGGRGVADPGPR